MKITWHFKSDIESIQTVRFEIQELNNQFNSIFFETLTIWPDDPPSRLEVQVLITLLRVPHQRIIKFSILWLVKTGYTRFFIRLTGICSCVRIFDDIIPYCVIVISDFYKSNPKSSKIDSDRLQALMSAKLWFQPFFQIDFYLIKMTIRCSW